MPQDNFRRLTLTSVLVPHIGHACYFPLFLLINLLVKAAQSSRILQTPTPWGQLTISTCVDHTPNVTCGSSLACLETCKACHFTLAYRHSVSEDYRLTKLLLAPTLAPSKTCA